MTFITNCDSTLDNDFSVHKRHLRYLAIEAFKTIMHLNLQFMWSNFEEKPMPYILQFHALLLRHSNKLILPKAKS